MRNLNFTTSFEVDQTPSEVFSAIRNVRGWWSEEIEGHTGKLNDEFTYRYQDVHTCRIKITEVIPDRKMVWHVLDNYFSFTKDKSEWKDTTIHFEISGNGSKTKLLFTHVGLVPEYECYVACVNGWSQYILQSLQSLITTGKGQPNSSETAYTVHEIAARFSELARMEKWFEIQDEFFADNVKSTEPSGSLYLQNAEGKAAVRKKGEDWVKRIEAVHRAYTTEPVIGGDHFAVGREMDITVQGVGRIQMNQVMLYEVKGGRIISEQFFY